MALPTFSMQKFMAGMSSCSLLSSGIVSGVQCRTCEEGVDEGAMASSAMSLLFTLVMTREASEKCQKYVMKFGE